MTVPGVGELLVICWRSGSWWPRQNNSALGLQLTLATVLVPVEGTGSHDAMSKHLVLVDCQGFLPCERTDGSPLFPRQGLFVNGRKVLVDHGRWKLKNLSPRDLSIHLLGLLSSHGLLLVCFACGVVHIT